MTTPVVTSECVQEALFEVSELLKFSDLSGFLNVDFGESLNVAMIITSVWVLLSVPVFATLANFSM